MKVQDLAIITNFPGNFNIYSISDTNDKYTNIIW